MNLDQLQRDSWQTAEVKGFHKAQVETEPETLALYLRLFLTAGELCEAGEELRDGREPTEIYYEYDITGAPHGAGVVINSHPFCVLNEASESLRFFNTMDAALEVPGTVMAGKPAGFPIELSDALIRLADLAESCGVNLTEATEIKARYNKTRAFLHGKKA